MDKGHGAVKTGVGREVGVSGALLTEPNQPGHPSLCAVVVMRRIICPMPVISAPNTAALSKILTQITRDRCRGPGKQ